MKKIITAVICIISVFSLLLSFTHAENIISTEGWFKTDGVDIFISATADESEVMPGKLVNYRPIISYKGVDSYIRFTLDITDENITLDSFGGLSKDWVRKGEYFYYKNIVKHNDEIPTFSSFIIPDAWSELNPSQFMGTVFQVTARCDAVQAENFNPDFENDNPWGNLEIEDNDYDGNKFTAVLYKDSEPVHLGFNGAGQYSLSSKMMVKKRVVPGSNYSNAIVLSNNGKSAVDAYFFVSPQEYKDKNNLLDVMSLTIKLDGKTYYKGSLRAAELVKRKYLCRIPPKERCILSYDISMPAELKNVYEEKVDSFVWNFTSKESKDAPRTGDSSKVMIYMTGMAASFMMFLMIKRMEKLEC